MTPTPFRSRRSRRARWHGVALLLAFGSFGLSGCLDPEPPVLFVPLTRADPRADPFAIAQFTLERLGYEVWAVDRARRIVISAWRTEDSMVGVRRTRVEIRIQGGDLPGFAVAVPSELQDHARWMMAGEDEEIRRMVIATLLARMQASSGGR